MTIAFVHCNSAYAACLAYALPLNTMFTTKSYHSPAPVLLARHWRIIMTTPKHPLIGENLDDTLHNFYEEVLDDAYDLKHSQVLSRKLQGWAALIEYVRECIVDGKQTNLRAVP